MLRIELDRGKCTGLGICESIDPDTFEIGDDGKLILLREDFTEADRMGLEEAAQACPTRALRVTMEL